MVDTTETTFSLGSTVLHGFDAGVWTMLMFCTKNGAPKGALFHGRLLLLLVFNFREVGIDNLRVVARFSTSARAG